MEDIRFYNFEFKLLHIQHDLKSSNWSIYFNNIGSFEGHFIGSASLIDTIMNNPYLVIIQGDKQAILTGKQIKNDEVIIYGRTVNWILTRRTIAKFNTNTWSLGGSNVEFIARYIISTGFGDISNFVLGEICGVADKEGYFFWRNTMNDCATAITDCVEDSDCGHEVLFDIKNKRWVFNVLLSRGTKLIVSEANRNASQTQYTEDLQDYYTSGFYEKQLESDENTNTTQSVWEYVELNSSSGIYKWDCVLGGSNASEGRSSLKAKKWDKVVSSILYGLKHGKDYKLGDGVRLQLDFNGFRQTVAKKIIGVHTWYEENDVGEEPILE